MVQFKTKIAVEAMTFNANGGDALGIKGIVTNKGNVKIDYNELENKPDIYTKTEIDGKVSAINTNISNVERRVTTLETKGTGSGSGSSTTGSISPIRTHSTVLNKDYNAKNITINGNSAYVYDTTAMESIVEDVLAKGGTGTGSGESFNLDRFIEARPRYESNISVDDFVVYDEGSVKRIQNPINPLKESLLHLTNGKVGYAEVSGTSLKMYADNTKANLIATLTLPSVTDSHINSLIDTKFGVIENGTY